MEGSSFHELPPSKRFKLRHLHEHSHRSEPYNLESLPAKKRLDSYHHYQHPRPVTFPCLPAKKRIWAPHPSFPIDLNSPPLSNDQPLEEKHSKLATEEEEEAEEEEEDDGVICAVCRSTDGDPVDPIVFCDGCDLMVHASCYGSPLINNIPEGDWFCSRCEQAAKEEEKDSGCCLCPVRGGATKPTEDGRWAHIVCALLVPEVFFRDPQGRDGIDCSRVPGRRWNRDCYLCGATGGCAIDCSEPKCKLGFHVSCGLERGLCFEYKERRGAAIVAGFCADHTELWKKQQSTGKFKIVARDDDRRGKKKA
ncbi:hypothetical protein BHE74_00011639 [Ensete ventricosum]|nr:hypothetical protein BHE74_00011639 [Ensete ventricosum]